MLWVYLSRYSLSSNPNTQSTYTVENKQKRDVDIPLKTASFSTPPSAPPHHAALQEETPRGGAPKPQKTVAPLASSPVPLKKEDKKPLVPQEDKTLSEEDLSKQLGVDLLLHEKKKIDSLFPKPYKPLSISFELNSEALTKIENDSKLSFNHHISFPSQVFSPCIRWKIVSLLHPSSAQPPLKNFVYALNTALHEKLGIDVDREPCLFSEIKANPLDTLSLADGTLTIFIGEEHLLSSLQQFLGDLPNFSQEVRAGFSPGIFLGKYFETPCLFLPIDLDKANDKLFKQEVWRLFKRLRSHG